MALSPTINRRDFFWRASLATAAVVDLARAQDARFVVAQTNSGKVRGVDNQGIKTFKGIPYGANTAGTNRFMPPAEPPKWTGIRDALEYGH